ncbi:MAG: bifunctional riboflavin kinase/FAD synthetase [Saprospiraceae bacterium]|nr:bifunctional riboflavin kinase/FAD synthetase [Saprospiraceae bacterium]
MQVHYDIQVLPTFRQAVITVGSFDGVHQGHRKLIRQMRKLAEQVRGESVVITFHPHPRNIVDPHDAKMPLLNSLDEKIKLLEETGIDHLVIVPFTIEFSQLSADEYIDKFLVDLFHPRYILIGFNHRFGSNRQGDVRFLRWKALRYGYEVIQVTGAKVEDEPISSTRIRKVISQQDFVLATKLLGQHYLLTGTVVKGDQIGRTIGFPTANISIEEKDKLIPPDGIYAANVIWQGQRFKAMLYIGQKPTVDQHHQRVIEVNVLDFNEQIYGEQLIVEVICFIRNDKFFPDKEALQTQIHLDRKHIINALEDQDVKNLEWQSKGVQHTAVIILNYNGINHLKHYLKDVLKACRDGGAECHIIDNGSTDGSQTWLAANYPDLNVIELQKNWGFAGGYNHGLLHIEAEFYFLLNSDIALGEGVIKALEKTMDSDREIAVCQPKILDDKQRQRFEYAGASGGWIDFLGYPFCRGRVFEVTEKDTGQYDDPSEVFWASGAAFMIRSRLFHLFGGFDPQFFAHLEEIDLCWRLKRAGYKIYVDPSVHVYHLGGGTLAYDSPRKVYLNFRNSLITMAKNERPLDLVWKIPARLTLDYAAIFLFLFQGKIQHIFAVLRAQLDFLLTVHLTILKRRYHLDEINRNRIKARPNQKGIYNGSIVWEFFLNNRKTFREIIR